MNFRNFEDMPPGESTMAKAEGNFTLTRQSSIYSLTFDEIQNTWSGIGKDVGSMNMDELLKNIWTAEESQALTSAAAASGAGSAFGGNLQRQGSLTLPRTISQKTVDEVWKDLSKESTSVRDGSGIEAMPQRQPTLGEVTLEEFLARAGVVREEPPHIERPCGFYGGLSREDNNAGLALGMLMGNQMAENKNMVSNQNQNAVFLGTGVVRPSQQQQQQPLFPKPATVTFASSMNLGNNPQLSTGSGTNMGVASKPPLYNPLIQSSGIGTIGLGTRGVTVASRSPTSTISSDVITKNSIEPFSYSPVPVPVPVPYSFGRGRRSSGVVEKVVERRQRRMIKNRESAARSRARKQAYTLELEAEIEKLKEMNQELQKKQREIMETQRNQVLEKLKCQLGGKRLCLRRTLTGPW